VVTRRDLNKAQQVAVAIISDFPNEVLFEYEFKE
jgi:hypothetical protein